MAVILYNTIKDRQKWRNWLRETKIRSCEVKEGISIWETEPRALHVPNTCPTQLQRMSSGFSVKHNNHPQVDKKPEYLLRALLSGRGTPSSSSVFGWISEAN